MDEKTTPKDPTFIKRIVDGDGGLGSDVFVVNVRSDADDPVRGHHALFCAIVAGSELQHGIRPIDMPIDGILSGKHALGKRLANDNDGLTIILTIERIKIATGNDGDAKRRKKSRRDATRLRPGVFYAGRMDVPVCGE